MLRLLLLLVVLAGAITFDVCRDQLPVPKAKQENEAGGHQLESQFYFYNSASSFKIRTGMTKLFSKFLFTIGQDKFLAAFHNQKAFDLIKAESLKVGSPLNPTIYFRKFIICHHSASADEYLLS